MPNIAVVTDSSANLPVQLAIENGITITPILLSYGGEIYEDGVDVQPAELYAWLGANKQVSPTSSLSASAFLRVFEGLSHRGVDGIAAIAPLPWLSGADNSAVAAAGMIGRPPVRVIHTATVAMAQGFAAVEAARAATAGADLDAVVGRAREVGSRVELLAVIDTLEYLQRGGRIGGAAALLGQALRIKPVLCCSRPS